MTTRTWSRHAVGQPWAKHFPRNSNGVMGHESHEPNAPSFMCPSVHHGGKVLFYASDPETLLSASSSSSSCSSSCSSSSSSSCSSSSSSS